MLKEVLLLIFYHFGPLYRHAEDRLLEDIIETINVIFIDF